MNKINPKVALHYNNHQIIIDVRTPAEYAKGHIPGALNIPLFSNEERISVGTTYKQSSPRAAFLLGLEIVGPKMAGYIKELDAIAGDKKIICYCWRGGQRSQSMSWLFEKSGYSVHYIDGGYKAYRKYVREQFEMVDYPFIVLGGRTGCGKSEILKSLAKLGQQVIDLEGLANHKGSAFGHINEDPQPSIEQFENLLYQQLQLLNIAEPIWIENESRLIGAIHLETSFWNQLKKSPLIYIDFPANERFEYLLKTYGAFPVAELKEAFLKIKKRLGGKLLNEAITSLEYGDVRTAAQIALNYYDKSYNYMLKNNQAPSIREIHFEKMDFDNNAKELIYYLVKA